MPRVAVVTGAGGGIGRAIAQRLATEGLRVAACDLPGTEVGAFAQQLQQNGLDVTPFFADVTDEQQVRGLAEEVVAKSGSPVVLVNAAGIITASRFCDTRTDQWKRVLDVNLTGVFLTCRTFLPAMLEVGWGRIVNIASDAAKTAEPWIAAYCASKFGLIGLTQSLALEFATSGVTVNAICPSISDTAMMTGMAEALEKAGVDRPEGGWEQAFVSEIPMRRAIRPEEVAHACTFFVSDQSAGITGEALNLSGGHEMH